MTRTVDEGFREFNRKLSLTKSESENLKKHRASIKVCLENNFGMNRFFKTGSIGNGTNISGYSDTDYFAGIPRENLNNNSSVTLRKIKEVLQKRFVNTNIFVNSPAIIVDFGTVASETTEIIPADFLKNENGVNIYDIPDKGNSWMKSSPKSCNEYVRKIDNDLKFKVKPLIRFVKAWKYYNNVPISSYFLEMKVAKYASNEETILYLIDLKFFFKTLIDSGLSKIINPSGIGGYINPCISDTKKDEAISKIKTAYIRICNAYDSNEKGEIKNVFEWLDLVFNNKFPTYYN